jgi:predicted O-methyltransferase YrrM
MTSPQFSTDWLSKHVWQFERHLKPLAGTPCRLLEIGCYEGRATCWLLEHVLTHPASSIVCVDLTEQPSFAANIGTRENADRVTLIIGPSRDRLRFLGPPASFDFVYVDGSHATIDVLEDAVLAFRLLKDGGIMGFDDYKWRERSCKDLGFPKPAIDAFLKLYKKKIEVVGKNYQVWIRKLSD